jgi:uncharacterized protein (TIGR00251 family)
VDPATLVRVTKEGPEVDLLVSPQSGRSEVQGVDQWRKRLVVKLTAPPEKGQANEELVGLLESFFGARVEIVRGHTNRMKTVRIIADPIVVRRKLEALE